MKKNLSIGLILFSVITLSSMEIALGSKFQDRQRERIIFTEVQQQNKNASPKVEETYTCQMHSGVISDKPGKCPKCGMNLMKKAAPKVVYTCPMHPEIMADKAGKCTKCGMNLEKKEPIKKVQPK